MKKLLILSLTAIMIVTLFAGCGAKANGAITVVSREEGSGTRGAFIELVGVEQKDANGNKVDNTVATAEITNSTSVAITTVAGNEKAIGYISLGSMNDTVKALKIDG
ncbi:MAG: phosphate ABC transporter substrate-binding protein, partial [Eubacteriaceae bacterium]|nr:phosphate ABC transporter substrate-binding protein [Eubacteriaceae bacterium]